MTATTEEKQTILDRAEKRKEELRVAFQVAEQRRVRIAMSENRKRQRAYIELLWRDLHGEASDSDVEELMRCGRRADEIGRHLDALRLLMELRQRQARTEQVRAARNKALADVEVAKERAAAIIKQAKDVADKMEHELGLCIAAPSQIQTLMFSPGSPIREFFLRGRLICEVEDADEPATQEGE
jgi:hypothetical protein